MTRSRVPVPPRTVLVFQCGMWGWRTMIFRRVSATPRIMQTVYSLPECGPCGVRNGMCIHRLP